MRRTLRASWMTTSGESWRLPAASHQAQAGTHPSRTLRTVSQAAKWWRCPQVRVNIHPGTDSRETQATCTTTNMCTTLITQALGSPKIRWKLRRPCACTAAFPGTQRQVIMDQSVVATQTAWDPTPWSMRRIGVHNFIISVLQPNSNNNFASLLTGLLLLSCSSKVGTQYKRGSKKGEEVCPYDMPGPAEEMEKNQKILLWLMEGQKEIVQHKRSPYGSVMAVDCERV